MECAYCGRKKRALETFTRHSFCPDCNAEVRDRITRGLEMIRATCTLCDDRMQRGNCPLTDSELLWRIGDALETIEDLEDLRPLVPFFKSSIVDYRDTLSLCKQALASGKRPVLIRPALSQRERQRVNFLKQLDELDSDPSTVASASGARPRRKPTLVKAFLTSRVAGASRPATLADYVALDIRTTGLNPNRHEIIEVSAIRFRNFQPVRRFYSLVLPSRSIPATAERLGWVTNELVRGAPLISEVIPALQTFIGSDSLVGYHLLFDLQFLVAFGLELKPRDRRYYDTIEIAQSFLTLPVRKPRQATPPPPYDLENFRLDTLCLRYSVHYEQAYHPAAICMANGLLFAGMVRERTHRKEEVPV